MPICITCSTPVKNLYTTYSKADDRSLGKGVRLTQCPNCKRFADKYVEHDYVVLFIDLVLIKPQVYRHLLFNRLGRSDDRVDPSILRLGILLILFDVYITWARIEKSNSNQEIDPRFPPSKFSSAPILTQYLFFLTLNIIATVAQHMTVRLLVQILNHGSKWKNFGSSNRSTTTAMTTAYSPNLSSSSSSRGSPSKVQSNHYSPPSPNQNSQVEDPTNLGVINTTASSPSPSTNLRPPLTTRASNNNHHYNNSTSHSQTQTQPRSRIPSNFRTGNIIRNQVSASSISTALLVSSCTKLFPILLVIWPTSTSSSTADHHHDQQTDSSAITSFAHRATSHIGWIVLLNNVEALLVLLNCGYLVATALAVAGWLTRWLVEGWLLSAVGLGRGGVVGTSGGGGGVASGEGPVGDVLGLWSWLVGGGG